MNNKLLLDWLRGDKVTVEGIVYIFPRGLTKIRKMVEHHIQDTTY